MNNKEEMIKKINPNEWYSALQVFKNEFFGKVSYFKVRSIINEEMYLPAKKRILDVIRLGKGNGTTYAILGSSIIKYLKNK